MADSTEPDPVPDENLSLMARVKGIVQQATSGVGSVLAFVKAHPKAAVVLCAAVLALSSIWPISSYLVEEQLGPIGTIQQGTEHLDAGEYVDARKVATSILDSSTLTPDEERDATYLLGAATAREAEVTKNYAHQRRMRMMAVAWLEDARKKGFMPGRLHEGFYLLGRNYSRLNRFAPAIENLSKAKIAKTDTPEPDLDYLLAMALVRDAQPRYDDALAAIDKYLASNQRTPEERLQGALLKAEILLKTDQCDAATAVLDKLPPLQQSLMQVTLMRGRLLLKTADNLALEMESVGESNQSAELMQLYQELLDLIKPAPLSALAVTTMTSENMYLSGRALAGTGDEAQALSYIQRARKLAHGHPLATAAGLVEAEMLFSQGRPEESVTAAWRTARMAAAWHSEPWLGMATVEKRLLRLQQQFVEAEEFAMAVEVAGSYAPLITESAAVQLQSETLVQWAEHDLARSRDRTGEESRRLAKSARLTFRKAGRAYARLAKLRKITRSYAADLWACANYLSRGQDYENAVKIYQTYLLTEDTKLRPEALAGLAYALLSMEDIEGCIDTCKLCLVEFPQHPAAYKARQTASLAYLEQGDFAKAKAMLEENLYHESLTPRSDVWRDSLFALGQLLYKEASLAALTTDDAPAPTEEITEVAAADDEASTEVGEPRPTTDPSRQQQALILQTIQKLTEATTRYPQSPQAIHAYHTIARAHRQAAREPQRKLAVETIASRRATLVKEVEGHLHASLDAHDEVIRRLTSDTQRDLDPLDQAMLQNSYFARGELLFDLQRFEDAIAAYSSATNRFQHEPAALEAYVRIASCYRRLDRPVEARGTIEQARIVLSRMPEDTKFERTTRHNRDQWEVLLTWMAKL